MKITHAVEIERQPSCIFSWLEDPAKAIAWMSSVSNTEILHRTLDLVGTTFRETVVDEHGSTELRGVVTACRTNQEIAFHLDGQFNWVDVAYRLEELAHGTRLTMHAEVHFKGVLRVLSLVMWPLFKRKVLDQFRSECAELKRLCEGRR
jgi:carbon monoxide dehydrogenase subunit G